MNEFNTNNPNNLKDFILNHIGGVLGGIIALILCLVGLYKFLINITIIVAGILIGNYIQKNKINVKEKLKEFIDKF